MGLIDDLKGKAQGLVVSNEESIKDGIRARNEVPNRLPG